MSKKKVEVKCPHCKKRFSYYESNFRPFCCERCQNVDLGHWLEGNYTVPSNSPLAEEDMQEVVSHYEEEESES
jgi:endogenous inhibitor of DNA gyrase (YacG/DUF329 family)